MSDPRELPVPVEWRVPVAAWLMALAAAGRSPQTLATRGDQLRRLARAMGGGPWSVTGEQLLEWAAGQVWAREHRRSVYAGVRSFYQWAEGSGFVTGSPAAALPTVRAGEACPRPAPDDVYRQALGEADRRTWLILRLAAEAGLRRVEVARVHRDDLQRDLGGWSLMAHGKGGKLRLVPLTDSLADAVRLACRDGWAFPGADGGHLSPRWVGKLATDVLPGDWTLHSLRHRFATRAYGGTRDLVAVQQLLGHVSVATTQRYVRLPEDALRAAAVAAA